MDQTRELPGNGINDLAESARTRESAFSEAVASGLRSGVDSLTKAAAAAVPRGFGKKLLGALAFGALTFGAAGLGSSSRPRPKLWYRTLRKSKANPPSWVFAPVWSALYTAIAVSGYRVWSEPSSPARTRALRLWALQMGLNASWAPLFFGRQQPVASAAVVVAMVPTIASYVATARRVDRTAAALMWPYLGWSVFAAYLNLEILRKNSSRLLD